MSIRVQLIQKLIDLNERLIFYPKLKKFYVNQFSNEYLMNRGWPLTVLDVGSNKGQSIDFFRSIDPKANVYGFEPNASLFSHLERKYRNKLGVQLFNVGVSSENGELLFQENIMNETSTFEELNYESEYLKKKAKILGVSPSEIFKSKYKVDVIMLKSFLEDRDELDVDVLKIDVEGHEYKCLKGLFGSEKKKFPIRFIQLENHYDDMLLEDNSNKIEKLLLKNNFNKIATIKHGFGDFCELIYENTSL